ncbi:MAG: ATP-dependent 6-phosphofructokinase [Alphaproteobacteria bacterium]|nr:ATP-dependent 6-phosphofructokinase [Alphaproteobacteria bacterium]
MSTIKRIGVLTSGGDCSGLNTAIWAVTFSAISKGWEVYGIENATDGLIVRPMRYRQLKMTDFDFPFARLGGTMLGTNNSGNPNLLRKADGTHEELTSEQILERFSDGVKELGLDALVVIGGDGSMSIVSKYCQKTGVKMVGIPKTIDNDAPATEEAIGFATARNIVMDALDKLDTTANSHERIMILEVMGRGAGHLALESAIAGMADICLIPEIPYTYEGILKKLRDLRKRGRDHALMVIAEGIRNPEGKHNFSIDGRTFTGVSGWFVKHLSAEPDKFNIRSTILGHVQRGGAPVAQDRILASAFAVHAIDLLEKGLTNRVVVCRDGKISDMLLEDVLKIANTPVDPNGEMVHVARGLGMYVGE